MKCIKSLLTACLLLCVAAVSAHDFEVDGIYYNITDATSKTVAVTYSGSFHTSVDNEYTGSVVIPESVVYNEKVYSVTSIGNSAFDGCSGLTSIVIPNSVTSIGYSAFENCSGLTSIEIPNSVTSIGYYAFEGCFGLTSIVIGNSVTSIGFCAFYNCSGLTSIVIGNSVTSIGDYAFYNCSGLTSVTIPNSVTSIGYCAFYNCSGLTSIEIPNSVTSVGEEAFYGTAWYNNQPDGIVYAGMVLYAYKGSMPENTSVIVKEGTISIKDEAFYGCSGLTSIEIPNSVTSIGNSAFEGTAWYNNQPDGVVYAGNVLYKYKGTMPSNTSVVVKDGTLGIADEAFDGCSGLTSIEIPNSVTIIGERVFHGCSGLTSITIPKSVTSIGEHAFLYCSGLTSIIIPNSVVSIGYGAFSYCSRLKEVHINDLSAWCNISFGHGANPLSYAENLYLNGELVTDLVIPDNVKEIKDFAFDGCSGLTSIVIPNSVTSIGTSAFWFCTGLTSIVIPNSVTSIGGWAFKDCSGLTSIEIPNSVKSIGSSAFSGCSGLTSIEIPNSVTSIGTSAFEGTAWYNNQPDGVVYAGNVLYKYKGTMPLNTSVVVKEGTLSIGEYAFRDCSGLTSIEIPNSVTIIGSCAFRDCSGLTSIEIPNSVTSIGYNAFNNCSGLTSIEIPNSVTSIGYSAFYNCSGLTSIEIPNSVTSIGESAFERCSGLTSIEIPNSVTIIGSSVFERCSGLTSIVIGNSVTSIGGRAFSDCRGLTSVVIGNSVTCIENYAFDGCSNLKSVINSSNLIFSKGSSDYGYVAYYADKVINGVLIGDFVFSTVDDKHTLVAYFGNATEITLPDNYNGEDYAIGDNLFNGNNTITSIIIPNSVVSIGDGAFSGCSGLKTVVNLSRLTLSAGSSDYGYIAYYADKVINYPNCSIIGDFVFSTVGGKHTLVAYLGNATEITLPDNYNGEDYTIGDDVFSHCSELENLTIPCCVTNIGNYAFNGCTSLKELCIEDGEEALVLGCNDAGKGLFCDCPLEILYVGRTLSYDKDSLSGYSPFYGIETLASVGIGTSDLDENLFDGCLNINNVGFNTEVAPSIFANHAKVTDVTLSGRVKLVSDGAFAGMDKLTNVVLETPVPPAISSVAFDKLHYKLLYVYLLDGCTPIYQASEIWKNFLDIQEFIPDGAGVCEAANVWRNYWDIPEYSVPEGEIEYSVLADVPQLERVSDGVRLPNAKGKRIAVYTFSGSLIKNVSGYSGETIALDKGTYIIVADNDAMKVVL